MLPKFRKSYIGAKQIRYLEDFRSQNIHIDYKGCDLQELNPNNIQVNQFESLADKLYKKYTRDGCIRSKSEVIKKSKKGNQNFYNSSDPFIDDTSTAGEKHAREPTYSDFKSVQIPIADFYKSLDYHPEVVVEAKRKL